MLKEIVFNEAHPIEMTASITLTIDLEDPTERYDADGRYIAMTRSILAMCAEMKTLARPGLKSQI